MTSRMAQQLTSGNPSGAVFGRCDDYISFYGAEPVVQPSGADQAILSTPTIETLGDSANGAAIAVAVNALITQLAEVTTLTNKMRLDLITLGLIKGS